MALDDGERQHGLTEGMCSLVSVSWDVHPPESSSPSGRRLPAEAVENTPSESAK